MKISDRIRVLLLCEAALAAACAAGVYFRVNGLLLIAAAVLCEGGLLLWAWQQILRPVCLVERTEEALLSVDDPTLETLHAMTGKEPLLRSLERLVRTYSEQMMRRSTAEIFDKQTELTALQSQINPHFLYNTLEAIRGQALLDDNEEIAVMTEALGAFFRYSISRRSTLVTLRDELANINNYMLIQRYRFNNRFSLEIVVDEEDDAAYECMVPRLIIQPVVENAIFHGLEDMDGEGRVTVEITLTEDTLILMISDNGKGIAEDELADLNARIHSSDRKLLEPQGGTHRTGIALPNIHRRIRLLYGEDYGVNVYSTQGHGTDVEILIPVQGGAE